MKQWKAFLAGIVLVALTAAFVLMPPYWNARQTDALVDQPTPWAYQGNATVTPDSPTVAQWYAAAKMNFVTYPFAEDGYTSMDAHDSAMFMLDKVLGGRAMHHRPDHFSVVDILGFEHRVGIAMTDERPTVLSFLDVELRYSDTTSVKMLFEEKTDTLVAVTWRCGDAKDAELTWIEDELQQALREYYTETLALGEENVRLFVEQTDEAIVLCGEIGQSVSDHKNI